MFDMTFEEQVIQDATEVVKKGLDTGCTLKTLLNVIKRQESEIYMLIRKKELLRDEICELQSEVERLKEFEYMYARLLS